MSLYHKYRPQSLADVLGNEETVRALKADLEKKDPPHALLFHGPTGSGKTTMSRIAGRMLGAEGADFQEIDSADFRGIDTIREIRRQANFRPLGGGKRRAWLLDECHALPTVSQEALLKGLEDPPPHACFILATTNPAKLLPTIRGRCAEYVVRPLKPPDMLRLLRRAVKGEDASLAREVYEQIAEDSQGLPRHALQILDQVLAAPAEARLETAKRKAAEAFSTIELCRALMENAKWAKVSAVLAGLRDEEPESIRRAVLGYVATALLREDNVKAGVIMEQFVNPFYDSGWPGLVFACYSATKL